MGEKLLKAFIDKRWIWITGIAVLFIVAVVMINSKNTVKAKMKSQLIIENIKKESISYDKESCERRVNELMRLCEQLNNSSYDADKLPDGVKILKGENIPDELMPLLNNSDETYMEKINFDGSVYCYAAKAYEKDSVIVCYEDVTGRKMTYAEFSLRDCKDRLNMPSGYEAVITDGKNVLTSTDASYENITEEEFIRIISINALLNSEAVKYRNYYIYVVAQKEYVNVPDTISAMAIALIYLMYAGIYFVMKKIYENRYVDKTGMASHGNDNERPQDIYDSGELSGKNILVFENNEFSMGITQCILEKNGANVVRTGSDNMAVEIFDNSDKEYFSMVILDVSRNITDCLYICTQIRGLSRKDAADVPILVMTPSIGRSTAVSEKYVNGWILKPVNEKTLMAKIKKYIS